MLKGSIQLLVSSILLTQAFATPAERVVTIANRAITYSVPVVAQKRPDSPRETVVYDFLYGGETILTVVFGPPARFHSRNAPKRPPLEERYNGMDAKTLAWGTTNNRFRETIVELATDGWAEHAYFTYSGISADGAAKAAAIIESIRISEE